MTPKRITLIGSVSLVLLAGAIGLAQNLPDDVKAGHHENLAAAQQLIQQAYDKIEAAQRANHSDLGGHAQKAEQLLKQADHELGMAADQSNSNEQHRR